MESNFFRRDTTAGSSRDSSNRSSRPLDLSRPNMRYNRRHTTDDVAGGSARGDDRGYSTYQQETPLQISQGGTGYLEDILSGGPSHNRRRTTDDAAGQENVDASSITRYVLDRTSSKYVPARQPDERIYLLYRKTSHQTDQQPSSGLLQDVVANPSKFDPLELSQPHYIQEKAPHENREKSFKRSKTIENSIKKAMDSIVEDPGHIRDNHVDLMLDQHFPTSDQLTAALAYIEKCENTYIETYGNKRTISNRIKKIASRIKKRIETKKDQAGSSCSISDPLGTRLEDYDLEFGSIELRQPHYSQVNRGENFQRIQETENSIKKAMDSIVEDPGRIKDHNVDLMLDQHFPTSDQLTVALSYAEKAEEKAINLRKYRYNMIINRIKKRIE